MDPLDLMGKVVIVTGASSGIGEATARLLHADGAHPVLAARRIDRLQRLSRTLDGALALETDVTDPDAVGRLVDATIERFGTIDGLVNNAGAALHTPLDQLDLEEFTRVLDLNVVSVVALMQAVLPAMRAQRAGRIVNVGSGTTRSPRPGLGAYAATKSAVNVLTAVAREEFHDDGVLVSLVSPSITASEFAGRRVTPGQELVPGLVVHSAEYVGKVILRALRTGEARIEIPHGPERADLTEASCA